MLTLVFSQQAFGMFIIPMQCAKCVTSIISLNTSKIYGVETDYSHVKNAELRQMKHRKFLLTSGLGLILIFFFFLQ